MRGEVLLPSAAFSWGGRAWYPMAGWMCMRAPTAALVCGEVLTGDASVSPLLLALPEQFWKEKLIVI